MVFLRTGHLSELRRGLFPELTLIYQDVAAAAAFTAVMFLFPGSSGSVIVGCPVGAGTTRVRMRKNHKP
jgi:hypothetical protein